MKGSRFSFVGVLCGIVAILLAIFQEQIESSLGLTPSIGEQIGEAFRSLSSDYVRSRSAVYYSYMICGIAAVVLGIASLIGRSNRKLSVLAIALGAIAVSYQFGIIALVIAIVFLLLIAIS